MIQRATFLVREYTFPLDLLKLHKIITFVWARRVGKSTIMKQVLHSLVENWIIVRDQIVRIDGNEIDFHTFNIEDVLSSFYLMTPHLTPFFVIDEVHELPDRMRQVFLMYNRWFKLFISWSNAHLLSSEISTKLRGKTYEQYISWLSWKEYCSFVWYAHSYTTVSESEKNNHFLNYCMFGSFPEVALSSVHDIKYWILKNYFEVLLYRDLIDRYKVDKEYVIKQLIKYIKKTITKEFSHKKFLNQLASVWVTTSKKNLYNYLEYLQNIFFIHPVQQKYKQRGGNKFYLEDTWYLSLEEKEGYGKKLENIVFRHLKRFSNNISFWINTWWEIDFLVWEENSIAFQVCRDLTPENFERETAPLLEYEWDQTFLIYYQIDKRLIIPEEIQLVSIFDFLVLDGIEGMR